MNKSLSWKILIPLGVILFLIGGMFLGDIGWLGFYCFVLGFVELIFPKQLQVVNNFLKNKGNIIVSVLLVITIVVVVIYYLQ